MRNTVLNWNVHVIKTTASIINKFCRVIETTKYSLWVVQICPQTNARWRTAAILKNYKNFNIFATTWSFWQNLACSCVSIQWIPPANKISQIQKSTMTHRSIDNVVYIWLSKVYIQCEKCSLSKEKFRNFSFEMAFRNQFTMWKGPQGRKDGRERQDKEVEGRWGEEREGKGREVTNLSRQILDPPLVRLFMRTASKKSHVHTSCNMQNNYAWNILSENILWPPAVTFRAKHGVFKLYYLQTKYRNIHKNCIPHDLFRYKTMQISSCTFTS